MNNNTNKIQNTKNNFESFVVEFRDTREDVTNIVKIIIEQNKIEPFIKYIQTKNVENNNKMKEFIKSKYFDFVESMDNIKECKNLVGKTNDIIEKLEKKVQEFLEEFKLDFIERIKKKEQLKHISKEKQKLNSAYIFFAYMNKADIALKNQQYESSIKTMDYAYNKFLKKFPMTSVVYKKGNELIIKYKEKITSIIQEKLSKWLIDVNKEQKTIGESLFKKIRDEVEKEEKGGFGLNEGKSIGKKSTRNTKSIVDSLLLIRNTSNLNYMMNKNSVLKYSILGGNGTNYNEEVEYDIINMVSNVDLKFLGQAYNIYKAAENELKYLDYFRNFRQGLIPGLVKIKKNEEFLNKIVLYEKFFSEIIGYIVIQISVYELYPMIYSKLKFENLINYLFKELQSNLSFEFETFHTTTEYITLQRNIFIFLNSLERIGISEKIGIDIRSIMVEMIKEKVISLNMALISKYNTLFSRMILDDLNSQCLTAKNPDDFMKYVTQYSINLDDNKIKSNNLKYPYKLPYTKYVIDVNENFKHYVDEIYEFVKPLYNDFESIIPEMVKSFLKKLNEVFIFFSNTQEQDINIISLGQICNNIKYVYKSHNFYVEYVKKKCNIKSQVIFYSEKSLKEAWQSYEEMIYEQIKTKISKFLSDLNGTNWLPDNEQKKPNDYVDDMTSYLNVIFLSLKELDKYYIETCFKDAIKFTTKTYIEILFNSNYVKNYNFFGISNLKEDIDTLDKYFKQIGNKYKDFDKCLYPIQNMINKIFYDKNIEGFHNENKSIDKFYKIDEIRLITFLERYKNIKNKKDMKGKITENDIKNMIKKLKTLLE